MREAINIAGHRVEPGERRTIDLPLAHLYTHTDLTMPLHVIHGRRNGPRLFITGAMHGDEINGPEIIRRLLKLKLINSLRGTLLTVPIVNVYGYLNHDRYLPDRRDLNRSFPGNENGSLAARLAYLIMKDISAHCTHGIDLHSGSNHRDNLPQIRASLDDPETIRLAKAFGAPVIIESRLRDGSLREAVHAQGVPMLLYEGGEALRFNEVAIRIGVRGIIATMRAIGMLSASKHRHHELEPIITNSNSWVRAPISGIIPWSAKLGTLVKKGDLVAIVADPYGETEENVTAPADGIVIGRQKLPMVHSGDALLNIALTGKELSAEGTLEILDTFLAPGPRPEELPPA